MQEMYNTFLAEKPVGNWLLRRLRWRWEDNIDTGISTMCYHGGWIELTLNHVNHEVL